MLVADFVARGLETQGHSARVLVDGREGIVAAMDGGYDVLIVDRMLPGLDGLALIQTLRASNVHTPAIFLTSMARVNDRVDGLKAGADDYLIKPFAMEELCARVEALVRRNTSKAGETVFRVRDLELNLIERSLKRGSVIIELVNREFDIMELLIRNAGKVVTRTMLLERVWKLNFDPRTSVVETHMSRLRSKVDKPFSVSLIHTIRGIGYSLHAPP